MSWAVYQRGQQKVVAVEDKEVIQQRDMKGVLDNLMAGYEAGGIIGMPKVTVDVEEIPDVEEVYVEAETAEPVKPVSEPVVINVPPPPVEPTISPEELAAQKRLQTARQVAWRSFQQALMAPSAVQDAVQGAVNQQSNEQARSVDYGSLHRQAIQQPFQQNQQNQGFAGSALAALISGHSLGSGGGLNSGAMGRMQGADQGVWGRGGLRNRGEAGYGYSQERRQRARTETELRVGTVIPAVMISGINSDLPGEILAQVSEDVRDSQTGKHVLIPQGSKLVGRYSSDVEEGQERVLIAWYRVNFPDGSFLNLDAMGGVDQSGYSGFHDKVNKHTVDKFKEATLLSLITGAAQLSQGDSEGAGQQLAAALGQQWGQVGQEVVKRKLDRAATLEIRPGYRFNVFINKDLMLRPYLPLASIEAEATN